MILTRFSFPLRGLTHADISNEFDKYECGIACTCENTAILVTKDQSLASFLRLKLFGIPNLDIQEYDYNNLK
jgi:hypothetical protein